MHTTTPIDPTLHAVIRDAAFTFGFHHRHPAPALRQFRAGRTSKARQTLREILRHRPDLRGVIRDAVNDGLHFRAV